MEHKEPAVPESEIPATAWTLVGNAGQGQRAAVAQFLTAYRQPLIAHLMIRRHLNFADAEDMVQGFILDKIVVTNIVSFADRSRGRFRNFLLSALDNYQRDASRAAQADKRAPDRAGAMPEDSHRVPPANDAAPDTAFDLEWARILIERTINSMRRECLTPESQRILAVFQARVLDPIMENKEPSSYDQLVTEFKFASPLQASNALVTAKRMFRRLLRQTISEYAAGDAAIDEEIAELFALLSRTAN